MYDTYITIVGNVLTAPEWRRTRNTNALVANFKVASTSRRFDKAANRWVDGDSLRVRVTCWRRLAEGVCSSIMVGDPVVVLGRMYTRDWVGENDEKRTAYELEAIAVGHDLSKGRARFERKKLNTATTAIEDAEAESRIGGEPAEPVGSLNATRLVELGEDAGAFDDDGYPEDLGVFPPAVDPEAAAMAAFRAAGLGPEAPDAAAGDPLGPGFDVSGGPSETAEHAAGPTGVEAGEEELVGAGASVGGQSGRGRRGPRRETAVHARSGDQG